MGDAPIESHAISLTGGCMKAELSENGTLTVSAETPLEAYALRRWAEENFPGDGTFKSDSFLVIHGAKEPHND